MDPALELALLQRRFPDASITECGRLIKDVFCARSINSHTYEGRLFLTEKAVFFASSYSDAKVYDVHIASEEVESVTAFHRSIIPSLEFTLSQGKEEFTNFHSLGSVVQSLRSVLPGKVKEVKPQGTPIKFNRMASVPDTSRTHPQSPHLSDPLQMMKASPCPFYSKGGFCPRKTFCQLDHGSAHQPLSPRSHVVTGLRPISSDPHEASLKPIHLRPSAGVMRSPKKRLHVQGEGEEGMEGESLFNQDMTTSQIERLDLGNIALKKREEERIEYARSHSLPAREINYDDESHSNSIGQNGNGTVTSPDRSCSDSAIARHEECVKSPVDASSQSSTAVATGAEKEGKVDDGDQTTSLRQSILSRGDNGSVLMSPELEVPRKFDFSGGKGQSTGKEEEESPEDANNDVNEKGQREEGVFVFTATKEGSSVDPASPDYVKSKRRGAEVHFDLSSSSREGGEEGRDEMAVLTQQLELGGSDNDSLQGDLDLEYQTRLLASFSQAGASQKGPFRGENAESASGGDSSASTKGQPPPTMLPRRVFPPVEETGKEDKNDSNDSSNEGGSTSSPSLVQPPSVTCTSPPVSGHKRQPCVYFLSGYCRNGPLCPDYHGVDPDLEDFDYDDLGMLPIPDKLSVHSASTIGRQDINSGDKIILSPQVLMSCEQQELSYPISFKLEHPDSGTLVYAGVLEFTSPSPDSAYLPQWMMDHLGAGEGEEMKFEHVDLPKGKFVRLQPVSSAWLGIPYDTRMAMMEFQLRNFQTLTEGTKVTLTYELNRYTLKVLECKPAKGISIVDSDLTTDIVEPADFNRYHSIIEGQAINIGLDEPMDCQLEATYYRHFVLLSLHGQPLPSRLHVEVKSVSGDPDLFLSQACTAPTQRRYTWSNQDVGDSHIELSTDEKGFDVNKPLYAGVVSLCDDTQFTIIFHRKDTLAAAKARHLSPGSSQSGKTLRDHQLSPSSTPSTTSTLTPPTPVPNHTPSLDEATPSDTPPIPPGHERCSYCGSVMPSLRLIMHERHCAQSTYKCPLCKACIPKVAEKKHHFIAHELLVCECGQELTQLALHRHQEMDCTKRTVKCQFKWCNLSFPMDQLRDHEDLCGRKKVPCPVCKEEVPMLEVEGHLEAFHSVDTTKIDFNKPLASQLANLPPSHTHTLGSSCESQQNFTCACGTDFQFQDDLQVHQLTECTFRRVVEDNPSVAQLRPEDIIG